MESPIARTAKHNMKDFIPYEEALALKALGFEDAHFGVYGQSEGHWLFKVIGDKFDSVDDIHFIKAPLYQQAFDFFREKKRIDGLICFDNDPEDEDHDYQYGYEIRDWNAKKATYNKGWTKD